MMASNGVRYSANRKNDHRAANELCHLLQGLYNDDKLVWMSNQDIHANYGAPLLRKH